MTTNSKYIEKNIFFNNLNQEIKFYIGKNQDGNSEIIDLCKESDLWFHLDGMPSCHVIATIPDNIDAKLLRTIIKNGAILCKQHSKYSSVKNISISYTYLKNITKTSVLGTVIITNEKKIII
jgi:predicted ribosome quality control (RQC) complex YloA/Tae2 family protein